MTKGAPEEATMVSAWGSVRIASSAGAREARGPDT